MDRHQHKSKSNNSQNPNKNICALAVANAFGVADRVHYLHKMPDVIRAFRTIYTVRSRKSALGKKLTVGAARKKLTEIAYAEGVALGFLIRVECPTSTGKQGHVIFIGREGKTLIDTAPRKRDSRQITECYIVMKKSFY